MVISCPRDLRYSCFRYLPDSKARLGHITEDPDVIFTDQFFRPVATAIVQRLKGMEVVTDIVGTQQRASRCMLLRSEFKFRGQPLLPARSDLHFAHRQYSQEEDFAALKIIGAVAYGKKDFVDASKSLTNADLHVTYTKYGP